MKLDLNIEETEALMDLLEDSIEMILDEIQEIVEGDGVDDRTTLAVTQMEDEVVLLRGILDRLGARAGV